MTDAAEAAESEELGHEDLGAEEAAAASALHFVTDSDGGGLCSSAAEGSSKDEALCELVSWEANQGGGKCAS